MRAFEILTFELLRLVADLQQLSDMEESAEDTACNYQNEKRLTHFKTTEFGNIPPWRCQVSQQICVGLLHPECLLRPADILQQAPDTDSEDWEN